tara:strand:- start:170896 stop:171126 length:231 start_codon:yes stop_codon:yes gene_type:complete
MTLGFKKKEKKHPNDYPLLSFRLDKATKDEITLEIEELVQILNDNRDENSYVIRKNDVFVEALREGIKTIKKKYKI